MGRVRRMGQMEAAFARTQRRAMVGSDGQARGDERGDLTPLPRKAAGKAGGECGLAALSLRGAGGEGVSDGGPLFFRRMSLMRARREGAAGEMVDGGC
jgi:hypothetical protein